jgi:hypothetical protein
MAGGLYQSVRSRAAGRCEYCHLPQEAPPIPFEINHIISRKHGGPTTASNLAYSCWYWKSQTWCLHCHGASTPNSWRAPSHARLTGHSKRGTISPSNLSANPASSVRE